MSNPQPTFSVSDLYAIINAPVEASRKAQHDFACDIDVLALTLDGEGRNQDIAGRAAIAWTVKNRQTGLGPAVDKGKPIHDICLRKWQYSAWLSHGGDANFNRQMALAQAVFTGSPDHGGFSPVEWMRFQESRYIAVGVLQGQLLDPTKGCTHYITRELYAQHPPSWVPFATKTVPVGDHLFFAGVK